MVRHTRRQAACASPRPVEVQRIDRDAEVGVPHRAHDPRRDDDIGSGHPRDEFEVDRQLESRRTRAEFGKTGDQARRVGIVAGGEHVARAHFGGDVNERGETGRVGCGRRRSLPGQPWFLAPQPARVVREARIDRAVLAAGCRAQELAAARTAAL
jgi:hypothetical protein